MSWSAEVDAAAKRLQKKYPNEEFFSHAQISREVARQRVRDAGGWIEAGDKVEVKMGSQVVEAEAVEVQPGKNGFKSRVKVRYANGAVSDWHGIKYVRKVAS